MRTVMSFTHASTPRNHWAMLALLFVFPLQRTWCGRRASATKAPRNSSRPWLRCRLAGPRRGSSRHRLPCPGRRSGDRHIERRFSFTEGFAKRFEIGYTREDHAAGNTVRLSSASTDGLNIFHGKAVLVPENAGKTEVGSRHRQWRNQRAPGEQTSPR